MQRAQRAQRAAPREAVFGRWLLGCWLPACLPARLPVLAREAESTKVSAEERPSRVCRWQPVLVAARRRLAKRTGEVAPENWQKSQRVLGCHNTKNRSKSQRFSNREVGHVGTYSHTVLEGRCRPKRRHRRHRSVLAVADDGKQGREMRGK